MDSGTFVENVDSVHGKNEKANSVLAIIRKGPILLMSLYRSIMCPHLEYYVKMEKAKKVAIKMIEGAGAPFPLCNPREFGTVSFRNKR